MARAHRSAHRGISLPAFFLRRKTGGADDNRYLWPEMLRSIAEIQPRWVVGENVAGLATMVEGGVLTDMGSQGTLFGEVDGVYRYGLRQTFTIERICKDLEGLGYSVQPVLIPAAAVGAPHRRERIYILASYTVRDGRSTRESDHRVHGRRDTCLGDKAIPQHRKSKLGEVIPGFPGDYAPERRWRRFPSFSPLIAGDDGLPSWLERKTLPGFWYEESLKAYGNAIVPQVMYRIFQCIEQLEK